MNTEQKKWFSGKNLLVLALGIVIIYVSSTSLTNSRFREIDRSTRDLIAEQEALLIAIAEVTSRNGADSVTEAIVKDCPINERARFEDLLNRLNKGLYQSELVELERLFGRCGSFFAERKSVMVARLTREIEVFDKYVSQLAVVLNNDKPKVEYHVDTWYELALEEQKLSDLLAQRVTLQDSIIQALLAGKTASSEEIQAILQEVSEVNQTLNVTSIQTSNIRSRLVPL